MPKAAHFSDASDDEQLKLLLQKFIRKSEVLERKESDVLKHVQLVQSAVASLQAWRPDGASAAPPAPGAPPDGPHPLTPPDSAAFPSERIDVEQIEEETRAARRETERLQQEIREKIEENKRLEEALSRRNTLSARDALESVHRTEIETREPGTSRSRDLNCEPRIEYVSEKLDRLREQEKRLKRELEVQAEQAKRTDEALQKKVEQLERESWLEKSLFHAGNQSAEGR